MLTHPLRPVIRDVRSGLRGWARAWPVRGLKGKGRKMKIIKEVANITQLRADGDAWMRMPVNQVGDKSIVLIKIDDTIYSAFFEQNAKTKTHREFGGASTTYSMFYFQTNSYPVRHFFWDGNTNDMCEGDIEKFPDFLQQTGGEILAYSVVNDFLM